ncbi:hypothetical protein TNIN_291531 [Trichonephila inaurata madagascariensis]|uniref:Uncharacterized protein n=1 Tax=Trichonephila inaurata madagascariensis TaxID=2747483 RepID=A0A8X7CKR2_9ARAC|nr:hypothetical protein TNIN_291531 [Trichonephila inaurata madagascariensis]
MVPSVVLEASEILMTSLPLADINNSFTITRCLIRNDYRIRNSYPLQNGTFLFGSDICVEEVALVGGIGDRGRIIAMGGETVGGLDIEEKTTSADN